MGFGGIPIQKLKAADMPGLFDALAAAGVNYVDTARGYTVSEEYIGIALRGRRDRFVLATKSMARDRAGMARDIETSLKNLKTDYIDLYQVHNPTPEQLRAVCAPGGALEALIDARNAGKIGHIGLTGHTLGVFDMALELGWVETFMFPYNVVETQCEDRLAALAAQGKAFICMKPLAGGAIEDARAALRFVAANPLVTVAIPGMASAEELTANLEAYLDPSPLTEAERETFGRIRQKLGNAFCRRCSYCAPCTVGIDIPSIFTLEGYLERYDLGDWARARYAAQAHRADECVRCGLCESRCPYGLPIRDMLARAAERFAR
jgi:predicted aldo/keto reductase-like oxidoreductase